MVCVSRAQTLEIDFGKQVSLLQKIYTLTHVEYASVVDFYSRFFARTHCFSLRMNGERRHLRFERSTIGIARFSACLKGLRVFSFSRHALMRFAQVRKFYANFWPIPTRLHRRDKAAIKSARRRMKGGKVKSPRYEPLEQNRLARGGIFRPLAEFFLCPKNDNRRKPLFYFRLFPSACGIFRAPRKSPRRL